MMMMMIIIIIIIIIIVVNYHICLIQHVLMFSHFSQSVPAGKRTERGQILEKRDANLGVHCSR